MCNESDGGYDSVEATESGDTVETTETTENVDGGAELYTENAEENETELVENSENSNEVAESSEESTNDTESEKTEAEVRAEISEKSNYSDEVNDHIQSVDELEIYQKAGLKEESVDGRTCLVKDDIDPDYVDENTGMTNAELMAKGRAPYDAKTGERIELHHIGQDYDSPLAELTADTEHGNGNHAALHTKESESWRHDTEKNNHYNNVQRPNHWKARV